MSAVRDYYYLVKWDCLRELARKDTLVSMVLFSAVTLFIFSIAIPPVSEVGLAARPGLLWATVILAGTIGIDRAFRGEEQGLVLEGLLLAPIGRTTLYYGRVTSTFLLLAVMEAIVFVAFCGLYNVSLSWSSAFVLLGVLWAGTVGFVAVGVTLSAFTRAIPGGEVLLRILLFPLLIPMLGAGVKLTGQLFEGKPMSAQGWAMIVAFDLIYLCLSQILFEPIISDFDQR